MEERLTIIVLFSILCDPMDCSPPGSSVHGMIRAGTLEWVAMPSFRESPQPRDPIHVSRSSCPGRQMLDHRATWKAPVMVPSSLLALGPDLAVGALEGASKEGGGSHSSDQIPCCTSSPQRGQCLSTAVANSSLQCFFLTLTTLFSSHRLRDLHQLS